MLQDPAGARYWAEKALDSSEQSNAFVLAMKMYNAGMYSVVIVFVSRHARFRCSTLQKSKQY